MAEKLLAFPRDFLLAPKVVSGGVNIAIFLILPLAWHYLIHKMKENYKILFWLLVDIFRIFSYYN